MAETDISPYVTGWNAPVFNGQVQEDAHMWISRIRYGLKQRHVPRLLWVAIAFHFLGEEPREVLNDVRQTIARLPDQKGTEEWDWDWETFTRALVRIQEQARKDAENDSTSIAGDFHRFRRKHPYTAAAAGLGLVAAGGVTVGPAMFVGALHMMGLTVSGVFGGSIFVAPAAVQAISAGTMALGAWVGFGDAGDKTAPVEKAGSLNDSLVKTTASIDIGPVKTTGNVENTAPIDNTSLNNTSLVENTSLADSTAPIEIASPVENTAPVTEGLVDDTSLDSSFLIENTSPVQSKAPSEVTCPVENTSPITDSPVDSIEENEAPSC